MSLLARRVFCLKDYEGFIIEGLEDASANPFNLATPTIRDRCWVETLLPLTNERRDSSTASAASFITKLIWLNLLKIFIRFYQQSFCLRADFLRSKNIPHGEKLRNVGKSFDLGENVRLWLFPASIKGAPRVESRLGLKEGQETTNGQRQRSELYIYTNCWGPSSNEFPG